MNKFLLGFAFFLGANVSIAQTFNQSNEPIIGDSKTMFVCDSNATNYASITGNGVTWDYSGYGIYPGETKNLDILDPSTTAFSSDFPTSTKVLKIENYTYNYTNSTATSRNSQGYVLEGTEIGDVKAIFSSDDQQMMTYPSYYSNSLTDAFAGNLHFTYSGIPQNPSCTGNSVAVFDGVGTFIQPNGVSISNVARFHLKDTANATIPFAGNAQLIRNQYEYYDLSGTDFLPIFMHMSAKVTAGFPEPLIDITLVLTQTSTIQSVGLEENINMHYNIFPNPAKTEINISNLPEGANVQLVDISGRVLNLETTATNQFSLTGITAGMYVVRISSTNGISTQNIVIE